MQPYTVLDSLTFSTMLRQGAVALGKEKRVINDLNVFPVPDGDTGDNMFMTMKAGVAAMEAGTATREASPSSLRGNKAGEVAPSSLRAERSEARQSNLHGQSLSDSGWIATSLREAPLLAMTNSTLAMTASEASRGMLLGARGNSGVILSRIFAGLAKGLKDLETADTHQFAQAMHAAVSEAYKAVPVPVEGTMITVMREGVVGADESGDLNHYFSTLVEAMKTSLDHTPELLQVLKDAGVVDSGGAGVLCVFQGMYDALCGKVSEEEPIQPITPIQPINLDKFTSSSTLEFGYCTEFLLRLMRAKVDLEHFDEQVIFDYLNRVGESVVAFREGSIVKVHVHTYHPGEILNEMQRYGEFLTIKVENMYLQHHQESNQNNASFKMPPKLFGIVTVASGKGLIDAFKESGADVVIEGGQTMNPSTQDFIEAFKQINAKHILVFPNNKNIKMAADQAAELYKEAEIHVMPSNTIGEGYYGIASADHSLDNVDEVIESVNEMMASVTTGMVSKAIRDAEGEVPVHTGDFVGYSGKNIMADNPSRVEAAKALLEKLNTASCDVLLVFYGEDVPPEEAETLIAELQNQYKNVEIILNFGNQPVYDYIFVLC